MNYVFLLYGLIILYCSLNIYQMSHYSIRLYFKYFINNLLFYNLVPSIIILINILINNLYINVFSSILLVIFGLIHLFVKPKLKITKRIIRAFILFMIPLAVICFTRVSYLLIYTEFIIIPIMLVEKLLAKIINNKYIVKAKRNLSHYPNEIIAITGSYGKTTTKNIMNRLLSKYQYSLMTKNSYNTPLGIASFINNNDLADIKSIVLEFGASRNNDISYLCSLYHPKTVIVTEIGSMHLDGFRTIENIIKEKMSICKASRLAILNYENKYIRECKKEGFNYISYGISYGLYRARNIKQNEFDFYYRNEFIIHIKHKLDGAYQILNILACLCYLHYYSYNLTIASRELLLIDNPKSRLEIKRYDKYTIIDDSFNSNFEGFRNALELLKKENGMKILITPGIVELGKKEKEIMEKLCSYIVSTCDVVILVGYNKTRILYNELQNYKLEIYCCVNFNEAYSLYKKIRGKSFSSCLIENDLPEIYRRGLLF